MGRKGVSFRAAGLGEGSSVSMWLHIAAWKELDYPGHERTAVITANARIGY